MPPSNDASQPFLKVLCSSAILALVVCLVLGGMSSSGVPSMMGAHVLFVGAVLCAVVGVVTAGAIIRKGFWTILISGILTLVVSSVGLYKLDVWLGHQREQLDALIAPAKEKPPPVPFFPRIISPSISVKGNKNAVISNSPINQQSTGPYSPNIVGAGNQITIGSVLPPPRILSNDQKMELRLAVTRHPFKALILYKQDDPEAYELAKEIGDVLLSAGWTLKQPVTGAQIISQIPIYGIEVSWHGDDSPPGQMVRFPIATPWGALSMELSKFFPQEFHVRPAAGADPELVVLTICAHPLVK